MPTSAKSTRSGRQSRPVCGFRRSRERPDVDFIKSQGGPGPRGRLASRGCSTLRTVRKRLKTGPPPALDEITAHSCSWLQQVEIEAELIELDELSALIAGWESVPASGSATESAAAAIETVVQANSHTPIGDWDRQAIGMIAVAAGKKYIESDEKGLTIEVTPAGAKR